MENSASEHLVPRFIPVNQLEVKDSFLRLNDIEKKYVHFLSQASWSGSRICLEQTSVESPLIFSLFQHLFHFISVDKLKIASGVNEETFDYFLAYVVNFYGNLGNYSSFGDQKFIPALTQEDFTKIITAANNPLVSSIYSQCKDKIYSLLPGEKEMGLEGKGVSTYYSSNITKDEIAFVQSYLNENKINPYNTRIFKIEEYGETVFQLRFASAEVKSLQVVFNGRKINLFYGDYAPIMSSVVSHLQNAVPFAANENQKQMLLKYVNHFATGNIDDHKDAQRWWIKDKGPTVETNIGFIESYRDPYGVRGEWEGFVAVVDKDMSAKFGKLVDSAESFIALLPWPKEFEKDSFLRPDFTSLELVSFASSGIPAGINIPNYNDIRQDEGFKNVSLGNVLRARTAGEKISFIAEHEQALFDRLLDDAFEVQVGIHELLGHGSGKLFSVDENGKFNFDKEKTIDPLTQKPVQSWYLPGDTFNSKFLNSGQTIEECRAECCGLYLCSNTKLLSVFGFEGQLGEDVAYINWLSMARKGLLALEFYSPETNKWRQAHMQARFVILNVLREAGQGLVEIADGPIIKLDRTKIETIGREAIGKFLTKIMVYKATADAEQSNKMYDEYSKVTDEYLALRKTVLDQKKPRKVFVQPHTYILDGTVQLKVFEPTAKGLIESFVTRFGPCN